MKLKKLSFIMVALLVVSLLAAGCGTQNTGSATTQVTKIAISTGSTSGTYYPLGSAISGVLSNSNIGISATAEATGGSVENAKLIFTKESDIAFIESGIADFAYNGTEMFKGQKIENIRGLIALYPNTMQTVVKAGSGINSYADLKGKRVAVGVQGGSTPLNMGIVLEQYGLTLNDIKPEYLGFGEGIQQLKDNKLDAVLVDAGAPSSAIIDIATQHAVKILPIEPEKVKAIVKKYPFFSDVVIIPAGTYKGIDQDITTTGSKVILATRSELSDDLVYNILKTIVEKKDEITKVHEKGNSIVLDKALDSISIPLHPGAEKYYKEKGVIK